MTTQLEPDFGQSALSAYRADLPIGGREPTGVDGETITIATLLRHGAVLGNSTAGRRCIREARRIAKASLGRDVIAQGCECDEKGKRSADDLFRLIAARTERLGQMMLADHVLASLQRRAPAESLAAGRIMFERARILYTGGQHDIAQHQLAKLHKMARRINSEELAVRADLGLAVIAWNRGNLPELQRLSRKVVRRADHRLRDLKARGTQAQAIGAALSRRFDEAVRLLWQSYGYAKGSTWLELVILGNLGQVLLDAGYPAEARGAMAFVLNQRPSKYTSISVIGMYALASAAVSDLQGVDWATAQLLAATKDRVYPRQTAASLLQVSQALAQLGKESRANTMRRRALLMATRFGFHDLVYLAEHGVTRGAPAKPSPMTQASKAIATEVGEMGPNRLPKVLVHAD